jgi:hypothetical protein
MSVGLGPSNGVSAISRRPPAGGAQWSPSQDATQPPRVRGQPPPSVELRVAGTNAMRRHRDDRFASMAVRHRQNENFRSGEGFRAPALCKRWGVRRGPALESLPRRKARGGGPLSDGAYGDLRIAGGWRARRQQPAAVGFSAEAMTADDGDDAGEVRIGRRRPARAPVPPAQPHGGEPRPKAR